MPKRSLRVMYLAVVVKVLDGEGFIVTSYFTERWCFGEESNSDELR